MFGSKKYWILSIIGIVAIIAVIVLAVQPAPSNRQAPPVAVTEPAPAPVPEPTRLYGIVVDSLSVAEERIKRNQNLAEILLAYNISPKTIHDIAQMSKDVFDVRKIAVNKKYTVLYEADSVPTASHFIYEPNRREYVVFQLTDSLQVYRAARQVDTVTKTLAGTIDRSLYVNMVEELDASPALVNKLVDVFGWQIDFFRVQENDQFKVIYEELQVEGQPIGVGQIKGAWFSHFSNPYYAIHYNQGKGEDFFDLEGNSLRKAFLRAPLEYTRISSRYSGRRFHPVQKRWKAHLGTDYAAPRGTPIRSVGDGIVLKAQYSKYNGNYVKIKHNATYTTQYLHMSKIASGLRSGQKVKQGQVIGYVGSTGLATGNHLCYRFWKNGVQVDALKVYIPPSEPIDSTHAASYQLVMDDMKQQLDQLKTTTTQKTILATVQ